MRVTPEYITGLAPNEVFVFGSNTAGRHGAGAARTALKWGARYGQGNGIAGSTYAIASLDEHLNKRPLEDIAQDVAEFAAYAMQCPTLTFLVTEIGCGLAGFTPQEIAPMFSACREIGNVHLPFRFWQVLP
jgi:hypothetical protein